MATTPFSLTVAIDRLDEGTYRASVPSRFVVEASTIEELMDRLKIALDPILKETVVDDESEGPSLQDDSEHRATIQATALRGDALLAYAARHPAPRSWYDEAGWDDGD
jgi:predicted RNase H-like HicB family nuclease